MTQPTITGAHLVGSVPLSSEEEVFATVGPALGSKLKRIPDGETGERQQWVQFQLDTLSELEAFEQMENPMQGQGELPPTLKLRDGFPADSVDFGDLGYERTALKSYATFEKAQAEGLIAEGVRFQLSMPTPLANAIAWLAFNVEFPALNARYEEAMLAELARILEAIPHNRLAVQWDVCFEVFMYEGWMPLLHGLTRASVADHLVRIGEAIPDDVELGFHFCYGDFNHQHTQQPDDLGTLVELANAFLPKIKRPVQFIHIPVPIERDDDAYFAPLADLKVPAGAEVYLGLLHFRDGIEGAQRRAQTAGRFVSEFGVATECGMGRRPSERGGDADTFPQLLKLHQEMVS